MTQLYTGPTPTWAAVVAGVPYYAVPPGPYAIVSPPIAVAFLPGPLLSERAIKVEGRGNKVFWAVKGARPGEAVTIDGYPSGLSSPAVHFEFDNPLQSVVSPAGAWLGGVPNVPTPGCWHLILRWTGHQAEIDLEYVE